MCLQFKRSLVGNPIYDPTAVKPGFWESFFYLNVDMVRANAGILERHNWDSVWWEWVLNLRGVLYYSVDAKHTYTEGVYLLGNPMAIWFLMGVVAVSAVLLAVYARLRTDSSNNLVQRHGRFFGAVMYCLITYSLNLAPYIAVRRSTFIYHYSEPDAARDANGRCARSTAHPPFQLALLRDPLARLAPLQCPRC